MQKHAQSTRAQSQRACACQDPVRSRRHPRWLLLQRTTPNSNWERSYMHLFVCWWWSGAPWGTRVPWNRAVAVHRRLQKTAAPRSEVPSCPFTQQTGGWNEGGVSTALVWVTPIQNRSQYSQIQLPQPQPVLKINPIHRPKHGVWGGPIVDEVAFASPEPACAKGGGVHGHTRRRHAISGACVVLTSPVAHPSPAETNKRQWATSPL